MKLIVYLKLSCAIYWQTESESECVRSDGKKEDFHFFYFSSARSHITLPKPWQSSRLTTLILLKAQLDCESANTFGLASQLADAIEHVWIGLKYSWIAAS